MEIFSSIFYLIIVIGLLVLIHEFGHFITARLTGMRTDIFSVGMGNRILGFNKKTGFSFSALPKDFDGEGCTDYRLSLFPIGGYVKISGMIDESMDANYATSEPQPYEFRSKKTWEKTLTISGGVIMNLLLAYFVFSFLIFSSGESVITTTTVGYVKGKSLASQIGFQPGDKILKVNHKKVENWQDFLEKLALSDIGKSKSIEVIRNNQTTLLYADGKAVIKALADREYFGLSHNNDLLRIFSVMPGFPASHAGIIAGDSIIALNEKSIYSNYQFIDILRENKDKETVLELTRNGKPIKVKIKVNQEGKIGISFDHKPYAVKEFSIAESFVGGWHQTIKSVDLFFSTIGQIFKGNITFRQSFGGPVMIANLARENANLGVANFLNFLAMLSLSLAIINILPFPALDGGHLIIIFIEAIIRRELPVKVKVAIQQAGMVLLLILMAYIIYNDFTRFKLF